MLNLDIGCGTRPKEGWQGMDIQEFEGVDKYDMRTDKLPYMDESVDAIRCINTLEHISREYYKFIFNDWWRVLRIGGTLEIVVPNIVKSQEHAWGDITHLSPWTFHTFKYLSGERPRYADYGFNHWTILELKELPEENRDIYALLTPQISRRTGKKYV